LLISRLGAPESGLLLLLLYASNAGHCQRPTNVRTFHGLFSQRRLALLPPAATHGSDAAEDPEERREASEVSRRQITARSGGSSHAASTRGAPAAAGCNGIPGICGIPGCAGIPDCATGVPGCAGIPGICAGNPIPGCAGIPDCAGVPGCAGIPGICGIPCAGIPGICGIPGIPGIPSTLCIPGIPGICAGTPGICGIDHHPTTFHPAGCIESTNPRKNGWAGTRTRERERERERKGSRAAWETSRRKRINTRSWWRVGPDPGRCDLSYPSRVPATAAVADAATSANSAHTPDPSTDPSTGPGDVSYPQPRVHTTPAVADAG
jgi:hypothetical protein